MGSEAVIQRIYFRNSCGISLRDFVTIKLERYCLLIFFCLHIVLFFVVNPSLAEHIMPCLSKQCRSRSVGF